MKQAMLNTVVRFKEALNLVPGPVVGLDVDSRSVKMVGLQENGGFYHVTAAAMSSIESADDGAGPSQRAVTSAIEGCLESSGGVISRDSNFVFGLSGPKVRVNSFNFPSLTMDEVANAVVFEAAQVCPFDTRDSALDYQLIGIDEGGGFKKKHKIYPNVKGVLAVAAKSVVSKKRALAEDALLKCVLMDSEGLALLNCLEDYLLDEEKLPAAVINVGMSLSTVAILGEDRLPFIRDLKYSGSDIIDHIGKGFGTGIDDVESKLCDGTGASEFTASIGRACSRLIRDINETLAYYSVHHSSNTVKRVYVCGSFSLMADCVKVLVEGIDEGASVWNPFSRMHYDDSTAGSELLDKCGSAFATAAGLAMRRI